MEATTESKAEDRIGHEGGGMGCGKEPIAGPHAGVGEEVGTGREVWNVGLLALGVEAVQGSEGGSEMVGVDETGELTLEGRA